MSLQLNPTIMSLVKTLFEIKTMNKPESVNSCLVIHLLIMMYNDVPYFRQKLK